jgi:hypothetical protein
MCTSYSSTGNNRYTQGRIDGILLPTILAKKCTESMGGIATTFPFLVTYRYLI